MTRGSSPAITRAAARCVSCAASSTAARAVPSIVTAPAASRAMRPAKMRARGAALCSSPSRMPATKRRSAAASLSTLVSSSSAPSSARPAAYGKSPTATYTASGSRTTCSLPSTEASWTRAAPRRRCSSLAGSWVAGVSNGPSAVPIAQPAEAPYAWRIRSSTSCSARGGGPRRRNRPGRQRIVHPRTRAMPPAAATRPHAAPRQTPTPTATSPANCIASAAQRRACVRL